MRVRTYRPLVFLGVALLGLAVLLAAPVQAQEGEGEGDPERGAVIFAENCAVCHGERGEGRIGATLSDIFVTLDADTMLKQVISEGREGTFMPAWSQEYGGPLTEQEINDVIAYIESWGTTYEPPAPAPPRPEVEIPPVPDVEGDPNQGYTIFQQNCAACHGKEGEGRIGATLKTVFAGIEPGAYLIETISHGREGTLMPAWSQEYGGPLTEKEINDVAAYILSIQQPAPPPQGEVVLRGSGWPLLVLLLASVVIIFALGVAVQRGRSAEKSGESEGH